MPAGKRDLVRSQIDVLKSRLVSLAENQDKDHAKILEKVEVEFERVKESVDTLGRRDLGLVLLSLVIMFLFALSGSTASIQSMFDTTVAFLWSISTGVFDKIGP